MRNQLRNSLRTNAHSVARISLCRKNFLERTIIIISLGEEKEALALMMMAVILFYLILC